MKHPMKDTCPHAMPFNNHLSTWRPTKNTNNLQLLKATSNKEVHCLTSSASINTFKAKSLNFQIR